MKRKQRCDYFSDEEKVRIVLKKMMKKIHHCNPYAKHPYNGNDFRGSFDAEIAAGNFACFINDEGISLRVIPISFKRCKQYYFNLYKRLYNKTFPDVRIVLQEAFQQMSGYEKRVKAKWCRFKNPDKEFSMLSSKIYELPRAKRDLFFDRINPYWENYQKYAKSCRCFFYPKNEKWYCYEGTEYDFCLDEVLCCLYDSDFRGNIEYFVEDVLSTKSESLLKKL